MEHLLVNLLLHHKVFQMGLLHQRVILLEQVILYHIQKALENQFLKVKDGDSHMEPQWGQMYRLEHLVQLVQVQAGLRAKAMEHLHQAVMERIRDGVQEILILKVITTVLHLEQIKLIQEVEVEESTLEY